MIKTTLHNLMDTTYLAHYLATFLTQQNNIRTVLLKGKMGSGKTTLTKALVEYLPNAEQAEVSSPSFTICNYYPTNPAILHCDLYRVGANLPDELFEEWDNINPNHSIVIIEWAEYITKQDLPLEYLDITFNSCQNGREATIELCSPNSLNYSFMNQLNLDQWMKR